MNTFSNFSSFNGCVLPGSGAWVTRDADGNFYVDENGDLWVPCLCGEGGGETGSTGGIGVTGSSLVEAAIPCDETNLSRPARIEYTMDTSGDFICVNYPEAILYYPDRSVAAFRANYPMGMLADTDKGSRWYYKGPHSGRVRLYIAQTNMTPHMALWDPEDPIKAIVPDNNVFAPGVELRYAVVFENTGKSPAAVTIRKQGGSLGNQPNVAQAEYFRSKAEEPITVEPHARKWLYLGRPSGDLAAPGPCKLVQDEARQVRIGTRHWIDAQVEVQVDMELSDTLTITCFAYADRSKVDFNAASMWPLPKQAGMPFSTTTGVSPVRQVNGSFLWTIDDSTYGSPTALELSAVHEPIPFIVPVAAPAGTPPDLDRMLFAPPPLPVTSEIRGAANCGNLANRGMLYNQMFIIDNRGLRARRVRYYVTTPDGSDQQACIFHVNEDKVLSYSAAEDGPSLLVASITVPGGESRFIETYHIVGNNDGLDHRLTVNDAPA